METTKALFTISEAAHYLSLGRTTVFELLRAGDIHCLKIGSATRVTRAELDRFIADRAGRIGDRA